MVPFAGLPAGWNHRAEVKRGPLGGQETAFTSTNVLFSTSCRHGGSSKFKTSSTSKLCSLRWVSTTRRERRLDAFSLALSLPSWLSYRLPRHRQSQLGNRTVASTMSHHPAELDVPACVTQLNAGERGHDCANCSCYTSFTSTTSGAMARPTPRCSTPRLQPSAASMLGRASFAASALAELAVQGGWCWVTVRTRSR